MSADDFTTPTVSGGSSSVDSDAVGDIGFGSFILLAGAEGTRTTKTADAPNRMPSRRRPCTLNCARIFDAAIPFKASVHTQNSPGLLFLNFNHSRLGQFCSVSRNMLKLHCGDVLQFLE